jgi:phosphoglycerol transferase
LRLAALTVISIVLGVTGGLSWVFGIGGFTEIRSWNRISVFIGFYALVAVGVWLDRFRAWLPDFRARTFVVPAAAALLVVVGVFDQTSDAIVPDSRRSQTEWDNDARFVAQIEETMPAGSAVFQLPYLPFPEAELSVPPYGMVDYDPLRGYVHSDDLSWGYGGTQGRAADWQEQVVELPTDEMLDAVAAVGFRGLWVDRLGYPERARDIESEVRDALGTEPIVSDDGRFAFFDLRRYADGLERRLGADGVRALSRATLRDRG